MSSNAADADANGGGETLTAALQSPPPATSGITSPTTSSRDPTGDSSKPSDYDSRANGNGGNELREGERDGRRTEGGSSRDGGGSSTSSLGPRVSHRQSARKVYVGNLPAAASEKDVMDLFANSPVPCALPAQIDMKAGYAFVVSRRASRRRLAASTLSLPRPLSSAPLLILCLSSVFSCAALRRDDGAG